MSQALAHMRAQIRRKMNVEQLPVLKATIDRVLTLTSSGRGDARDLANVILRDRSFSMRILTIANGSYYQANREPITSVLRAVTQMGYTALREITHRAEPFAGVGPRLPRGMTPPPIFAEALVGAYQARALDHALRLLASGETYTLALLQHVGALALVCQMPEEWQRIQAGTYQYFVDDYALDNQQAALDAGRP